MHTATQTLESLRQTLLAKFPDAIPRTTGYAAPKNQLDITFGQIIEITGGESSGRISLLGKMLPVQKADPLYWLSLSGRAFPVLAQDVVHFELHNLKEAISTCLAMIGASPFQRIVMDVSNLKHSDCRYDFTPRWYQLRRVVVRQFAQLAILTPEHARLLPDSVVTKKIKTLRTAAGTVEACIEKSRVGGEGMRCDVTPTP